MIAKSPSTPAVTYSPRAVVFLRKAVTIMRRELEAGERTWTTTSLTPTPDEPEDALATLCREDVRLAAARFFESHSGNALQIDRNISAGFIRIHDPLNGVTLASTKSLIFRKYQFFFFSHEDEPIVLGCVGSRPSIIIYPTRKIMIDVVNVKEDRYNFISAIVRLVRSMGLDFYRHLSVKQPALSACLVGDERPTHYLLESLGALQKLHDADRLKVFWKNLDYLIVPTDYAFIPADELFDVPSTVQIAYVPLADINRFAVDRNLFVQRFMRSGHNMSEPLRRRVLDYAEKTSRALDWPDTRKIFRQQGYVTIWLSIEIEKGRIQNQDEVFEKLLAVLTERFGDRFRMIVDGWSPMPLSTAPKDKIIAGKIRAFMRDQMKTAPAPFDIIEAFTLPYRDKLKLCGAADFFVSMQGAAALVPSGLCHKPGVTYHNTWGLSSELEVWVDNLRRVTARKETLREGQGAGRAAFEVDIPLFRKTLEQLIDEEKIGAP